MVVEREDLYDERGLPKKPLRLSKLPFLMRKKAIALMSFGERIRLAVVSEDMENYVKESRSDESAGWYMKICDSSASILITDKVEVAVTDNFPAGDIEGERIPKREIAKWCDDKKEPFENVKIVLKKLQDLFVCTIEDTVLFLKLHVAEQKIFEILSAPVYKDVKHLEIQNYRLANKTIDKIMEFCEFKGQTVIMNLVFPNDYYHEKALKCERILYGDATWIRGTQLLTLRFSNFVYLSQTYLNMEDMASLVNFWATVDYDMFKSLDITMIQSGAGGFEWHHRVGALEVVGFEEIAEIFSRRDGEKFYLMESKSRSEFKTNQVLAIQIANKDFNIIARPIDDFKEWIDILDLVHLKNEKEVSLRNFRDHCRLEDWARDELREPARRLEAERQELKHRLMNLNMQIAEGRARFVREPAPAVE